jgi:hypothetical protein
MPRAQEHILVSGFERTEEIYVTTGILTTRLEHADPTRIAGAY